MTDRQNWTTEHDILSCFICPLVYGDTSGLTDREERQFNQWLEEQYYWVRKTAPTPPDRTHWAYGHEDVGELDEFGRCEITDLRGETVRVTLHWRLDTTIPEERRA